MREAREQFHRQVALLGQILNLRLYLPRVVVELQVLAQAHLYQAEKTEDLAGVQVGQPRVLCCQVLVILLSEALHKAITGERTFRLLPHLMPPLVVVVLAEQVLTRSMHRPLVLEEMAHQMQLQV